MSDDRSSESLRAEGEDKLREADAAEDREDAEAREEEAHDDAESHKSE